METFGGRGKQRQREEESEMSGSDKPLLLVTRQAARASSGPGSSPGETGTA